MSSTQHLEISVGYNTHIGEGVRETVSLTGPINLVLSEIRYMGIFLFSASWVDDRSLTPLVVPRHFRQQCTKEYRTGETCGLKLVFNTNLEPDKCKLCKDIEKKQRRYTKLQNDIIRWQREGNRNATIEKAQRDMREVEEAIRNMGQQHDMRQYSMA